MNSLIIRRSLILRRGYATTPTLNAKPKLVSTIFPRFTPDSRLLSAEGRALHAPHVPRDAPLIHGVPHSTLHASRVASKSGVCLGCDRMQSS